MVSQFPPVGLFTPRRFKYSLLMGMLSTSRKHHNGTQEVGVKPLKRWSKRLVMVQYNHTLILGRRLAICQQFSRSRHTFLAPAPQWPPLLLLHVYKPMPGHCKSCWV